MEGMATHSEPCAAAAEAQGGSSGEPGASATTAPSGPALQASCTASPGEGARGSASVAVAERKGQHATEVPAGPAPLGCSTTPRCVSGQPASRTGCAQPSGRSKQDTKGRELEGVGVRVAERVAEGEEVAEDETLELSGGVGEWHAEGEPEGRGVEVGGRVGVAQGQALAVAQKEGGREGLTETEAHPVLV